MPTLRSLLSDRRGNTALMFSLLAIPLLAGVGAFIDYTRAATTRTQIQAAIDAAVLKLAHNGSTWDQARMQLEGDALVRSLLAGKGDLTVTGVTVTKGTSTINIAVTGGVPIRFGFLGGPTANVGANTKATWGVKKLEIAMALDNTGSMSGSGKIQALRTAVVNFANTMEAAATTPDSIRIALVPFERYVKASVLLSGATWLRGDLMPNNTPWTGCITDRDQSFDVNDAAPNAGVQSTLYPKVVCGNNAFAEVRPLTNDFNAVRAHALTMQASGNTNVTIGVAWAHAMLNSAGPFPGAIAYGDPDVEKFMIVLTDGDNTQNRWTSNGNSIDARTTLACTAAKAHNIRVYTIRVINGDANLLRNCATNTSMYFEVQNAAQLDPVFQQIAASIKGIRLTQ